MVRMASSTWPVATSRASALLRASSRRATTEAFCWNKARRFSSGVPGFERNGLLQLGDGFGDCFIVGGTRWRVHVGSGQVAMGDGERGVEGGRCLPHTDGFLGLPVV